jgi:phosphinothricin acetyltransferase
MLPLGGRVTIADMIGGNPLLRDAVIRDARASDAAACAAIYQPYVTDTAISLETDPPSPAEMAERIASAVRTHAWLVLEAEGASRRGTSEEPTDGGRVVGYAYGGPFSPRAGYRWSCGVSVYLELGLRRGGAGRALYEALFARLAERGYRMLLAGMTLPNDASEGLHRALGFEPAGIYRRVGWKHGSWHDVAWVQRGIGDQREPPAEPR